MGVIPAHINEISPGPLRGFFPGLAYQFGVMIAATAPYIEARMTHHFTYALSMGMFAGLFS
jgi:SHS family lactate transporter-like MFS transporter